ncbi:hypothetical protein [Dactylosporangium sp. NPDC005555]|uniref:hypothetical protein n=1 Tax=Dactylosporangium sp. NPDC005555 TaxID=3154889 RepID=UPI0033B4E332
MVFVLVRRVRGRVDDAGRLSDLQLGEQGLLGLGQFRALAEGAGGGGEHADVQPLDVGADLGPGVAGGGFGDADE